MHGGDIIFFHGFHDGLGEFLKTGKQKTNRRPSKIPPEQFPYRYIEEIGCFLHDYIIFIQGILSLHPI